MIARVVLVLTLVVFETLVSACNPSIKNTFTADSQTIVLYANLEINSGPPRPGVTCRYPSVPVLRVWGDGLSYVWITDPSQATGERLYKGIVSSRQINDLLDDLNQQGFFGNWTPEMASPAANYLHFGVNLKNQSKERLFSSLEPAFYNDFISKLTPFLTQFTRGASASGEPRIDQLNDSRECTTPTPR